MRLVRTMIFLLAAGWLGMPTALAALPYSRASLALPPENWETRQFMFDSIIAPLSELRTIPAQRITQFVGMPQVLFRVDEQDTHFSIHVLNRATGINRRTPDAGSYIIRRAKRDGAIDRITIFLRSDSRFYIELYPTPGSTSNAALGSRTRAVSHSLPTRFDLVIAGSLLHRNIPLAMTLEDAVQRPFHHIIEATAAIIDWDQILTPIDTSEYREIERIVTQLGPLLPLLPDAEDGAMDAEGNLVFIETLGLQNELPGFNCSGFVKWVADGIYRPITGRYLEIARLTQKHITARGHRWSNRYEELRDPYFGLDWSRNIGIAMREAQNSFASFPSPEAADVREVPFSTYVEDVGYPIDELSRILYLRALENPKEIYIGSINRDFGSAPTLRQHFHLVLLLPYFDQNGKFRTIVMERNVETSVESLEARYGNDYIHLVALHVEDEFDPPSL